MASLTHSRIYRQIVDALEYSKLDRRSLVNVCLQRNGLSEQELADRSVNSKQNKLRSRIGATIAEMEAGDLIGCDSDGMYYLISSRPVVIRIEKCERELLRALSEGSMSKKDLRDRLKAVFGTEKTASKRDDETLMSFMGQIIKKLLKLGVITQSDKGYSLSPKASAKADKINEMMTLKSEFISRIHALGGEFFENYFMTLLSKYEELHGKRVLECYVNGGSADGGIDGVIKTQDSLGFRELIMVQTKNRTDIVSETDVRGFYGAVCAKRGTRGIFASSSDFHYAAADFLDNIDDCVAVNGAMLFRMARECCYGLKKDSKGKYTVDEKVLRRSL